MTSLQGKFMNIPRVVVFAIALLFLRSCVSAITDSPMGSELSAAQLALRYSIDYLLDAAVVSGVFVRLALVQARSLYLHVFSVLVLHELLGALLLFAIGDTNHQSPLWMLDWAVTVLSVLLGTELGRRWRTDSR
ncbi:hypothetical protein ABE473_07375 [Stenotrophomonas sp. TWI700]|uniref:hypothetical protein n=1 Tax=Stenotrophomonas sp. TWI700 TaxID=3136792 RepID=UPI00320AE45B